MIEVIVISDDEEDEVMQQQTTESPPSPIPPDPAPSTSQRCQESIVDNEELMDIEIVYENIGWAPGIRTYHRFNPATFFNLNAFIPELDDTEVSMDEMEAFGERWDVIENRRHKFAPSFHIQRKEMIFKDPRFALINDALNNFVNDEIDIQDIEDIIPSSYVKEYGSKNRAYYAVISYMNEAKKAFEHTDMWTKLVALVKRINGNATEFEHLAVMPEEIDIKMEQMEQWEESVRQMQLLSQVDPKEISYFTISTDDEEYDEEVEDVEESMNETTTLTSEFRTLYGNDNESLSSPPAAVAVIQSSDNANASTSKELNNSKQHDIITLDDENDVALDSPVASTSLTSRPYADVAIASTSKEPGVVTHENHDGVAFVSHRAVSVISPTDAAIGSFSKEVINSIQPDHKDDDDDVIALDPPYANSVFSFSFADPSYGLLSKELNHRKQLEPDVIILDDD